MTPSRFHPLRPGATIPGDWYHGVIPSNIEAGENSVIDSSFCFRMYRATGAVGLRAGRGVTIWRTSLAIEADGLIEIGDYSFIANASLVCASRISLGAYVMIAGGVTIVDSDFHPVNVEARVIDTVVLSPAGKHAHRPAILAEPVIIEDDVWIGYNATLLKGIHIGAGAVIAPGAVVPRDVPAGARVAGNPARIVENV